MALYHYRHFMPIHTLTHKEIRQIYYLYYIHYISQLYIVHSIINQKTMKRDEHNGGSLHSYHYILHFLLTLIFHLNFEDFPVS